jgi:hypothetical protein
MVVIRCEPRPTARSLSTEEARQLESRRLSQTTLELDTFVIEAEAPRRATLSRGLASPPRHGTYTYTIAEGAQCSCMNRCPPVPFPCCQCSGHPSRYGTGPGSSPLR